MPSGWQTLGLEIDHQSRLAESLEQVARGQFRTRLATPANHQPSLIILGERFLQPVLSLDTLGRAREYLLEYVVTFRVSGPDKKPRGEDQRVYVRRDQTHSSSRILAKENELAALKQEMQLDAARQIMQRVARLAHLPPGEQ